MNFLAVFLVLVGVGAGTAQQGDAGGSASADLGGCSGVGAEGDADANGNSAGGSASVSGPGCGSKQPGYTYIITNAQRVSQTIPAAHPVMYMYYQIQTNQNLTYFRPINEATPFLIEYYVANDKTDFSASGDGVKTCGEKTIDGWDSLIRNIVTQGLMPDGKCPVEKGSYSIRSDTGRITAYFDEKIPCGDYTVTFNLDRQSEWAMQADYAFEIKDDGNCIS